MATPRSVGQRESDRLAALLEVAIESKRPREELLRLVLAAALPLAGADLVVVCGPDGELVAVAPGDESSLEHARTLAAEACKALARDAHGEDVYVSRLAISPPSLLAVRWARGHRSRPEIAQAIAVACARLLQRVENGPLPAASPHEIGVDTLTELPSRAATLSHLANAIEGAKRVGGKVGVLFIDLDGFKQVNDTFGHSAGDRALVDAATQMRNCVRRGDFVGRLGGDEFVAILNVVDDESEMEEAAQRFLDRVVIRVEEEGLVRVVGTSVGVAVYPQDGGTSEALIDHADHAMYAAKQAGGRSVCWFRDGIGRELHARRDLRERLRSADIDRDFLVCYQPIVEANTMKVVGAEALVRWRHPSRGWLAPRTFMPAGIALGVSQAIDVFVASAVLSALRTWEHEGLGGLHVHVNITNTDEHVCAELERALHEMPDLGPRLGIEIAASAALADPDRVGAFLARLRRLGVNCGLDGFGTDPIAFEGMAALPLDFLKISRNVTERAWRDERWKRIARGAIAFADALEVRPIADGVQNGDQARWLAENGIDAMQGYFFAQPMTAPDFAEWVRTSHAQTEEAFAALPFSRGG